MRFPVDSSTYPRSWRRMVRTIEHVGVVARRGSTGKSRAFRMLIVPLDGSEHAERVLPHLESLVAPGHGNIVLLRVVQPPSGAFAAGGVPAAGMVDLEATAAALCDDAASYLRTLSVGLREEGLRVTTKVVVGSADQEITEQARLMRADLIVMSTHARGGLGRMIYGSVADAVLQHAPCPVFLLPLGQGSR
jgi:nucleotide-binding universal stress UspA family protein